MGFIAIDLSNIDINSPDVQNQIKKIIDININLKKTSINNNLKILDERQKRGEITPEQHNNIAESFKNNNIN